MTALRDILIRQISAQGPITVAEYMAACLLHPRHGYYVTRDPLGMAGDFTTAPEISQMFGEVLGLLIAQAWQDQGAPSPITLAEFGPGRGTLMADMLRATQRVPGFHGAIRLHLVEASPVLRDQQKALLGSAGVPITWHESVTGLPVDQPLFLLANEFFDALPIRQFQRMGTGWAERMLGLQDGDLALGLGPVAPLGALSHRLDDTEDGMIVETCPAAVPILQDIADRINAHGGVGLIIDYGDWRSRGDTLQALYDKAPDDPFAHPGEADLTAHVDFEALARAAHPLQTTPLVPQGVLLERLGITARAQALAAKISGPMREAHIAAHRRLTHPQEMGHLFKALAIYPHSAPMPPGFGQ